MLKKFFLAVAQYTTAAAFAAAAANTLPDYISPYLPGKPLEPDFKDRLQNFWGRDLDVSRIKILRSDTTDFILTFNKACAIPFGATIIIRQSCYKEQLAFEQAVAHETAHMWQKQSMINPFIVLRDMALNTGWVSEYHYSLAAGINFSDLNHEQQAAMIADYYSITHGSSANHVLEDMDDEQKIARYQKILSPSIPQFGQ